MVLSHWARMSVEIYVRASFSLYGSISVNTEQLITLHVSLAVFKYVAFLVNFLINITSSPSLLSHLPPSFLSQLPPSLLSQLHPSLLSQLPPSLLSQITPSLPPLKLKCVLVLRASAGATAAWMRKGNEGGWRNTRRSGERGT